MNGRERADSQGDERKPVAKVVSVSRNQLHAPLSRLARMRNPSCLISCIQSVPAGGLLAGLGRHGSTMPTVLRLRSDMIAR